MDDGVKKCAPLWRYRAMGFAGLLPLPSSLRRPRYIGGDLVEPGAVIGIRGRTFICPKRSQESLLQAILGLITGDKTP